ncbi:hypothetical protein D3C73_656710 [compost metagenome]
MSQSHRIAGQHTSDLRLVKHADLRVHIGRAHQLGLVQPKDLAVVMEGAAAFVLPRAENGRDGQCGMHGRRAVALAGKPVTEAKESLLRRADQTSKILDLLDRKTGDFRRPLRRTGSQMCFEASRIIRIFRHIFPVGITVAEGDMHQGAGECCIGAGAKDNLHVGLFHRRVVVDVDNDDLGTAFLAGLYRVGHHIDLSGHRIGAPDDDTIGFGHLARIGTSQCARAHHITGPGHVGADRTHEAGIFFGMAQALDTVALHLPHRACVEIRPDGFRAMLRLCLDESIRDLVECRLPGKLLPASVTLGSLAALRHHETARMIEALGIARDLGADDACRIGVIRRPPHATDFAVLGQVDIQRAGARTVVRTDGVAD